jgi:hypothetical protein
MKFGGFKDRGCEVEKIRRLKNEELRGTMDEGRTDEKTKGNDSEVGVRK